MKQLTFFLAAVFYACTGMAQTDTLIAEASSGDTILKPKKPDTMRIGNIIIIRKNGKRSVVKSNDSMAIKAATRRSRVVTNWGLVDLGFSTYSDKTDYGAATADGYLVNRPGYPGLTKDDFRLRSGKSINVNIWFFMQQLYLVKRNVSLKYGLGIELNNYRFRSSASYKENGQIPYSAAIQSNRPFIFRDSINFSKNKLAADYVTVPLMVNFSTNKWGDRRGFNIAFGVSGGYLYSQRNKQKSDLRGKLKNRGDYDLERFKFSYIGEIGVGPVKFYALWSPQSIYQRSLEVRPLNFGIRLGN